MAKRVTWSENALQDRLQILDYWFRRIGTKRYSEYLDSEFRHAVAIISRMPQAGRIHNTTKTRFLVKEYYLIFYEERESDILLLAIFDGRRNPELLDAK